MPQPQRFTALVVENIGEIVPIGRHGAEAGIVSTVDARYLYVLKGLGAGTEKQAVNAETSGGDQQQYHCRDGSQAGLMMARCFGQHRTAGALLGARSGADG